MKILVLSDIHSAKDVAKSAAEILKPNLILDCGDHSEIINIFGQIPHFYIRGNHEPDKISFNGSHSIPNKIEAGIIYEFNEGKDKICFSGLDGNYSEKKPYGSVNERYIELLSKIPTGSLDIFLVHESPLNLNTQKKTLSNLASRVLSEIERIKPSFVFSGHANKYKSATSRSGIMFVELDDITKGYLVINKNGNCISLERKIAVFANRR